MSFDSMEYAWPMGQLADAIEILARKSGLLQQNVVSPWLSSPELPTGERDVEKEFALRIDTLAAGLGLEAEEVDLDYSTIVHSIRQMGPTILKSPSSDESSFLVLLGRRGRKLRLIAPDHSVVTVPMDKLVSVLVSPIKMATEQKLEPFFQWVQYHSDNFLKIKDALIHDRIKSSKIGNCWLIRLPANTNFRKQLAKAGIHRRFLSIMFMHVVQYGLMLAAWWVIGMMAFGGNFDLGWLGLWILLLATRIPFELWIEWSQSMFALQLGALLKPRLLWGCLQLEPDETRHMGVGQLLGRTIETMAVEKLSVSVGFNGIVALVELVISAIILSLGPGGWLRFLVFLVWVVLCLTVARRVYLKTKNLTENRVHVTNDLVERMVGHRTRLMQERAEQWHEEEDQLLEKYHSASWDLDSTTSKLYILLARGWMVVGILSLMPIIVFGEVTPLEIAVAIGGILLAYQAFSSLNTTAASLISALVSWRQVAPLYKAAERNSRSESRAAPVPLVMQPQGESDNQPVLDALGVVFAYGNQREPVLNHCNLTILPGEKILLKGPSGGGKTTLASVMAGIRTPQTGSLLLHGMDQKSLGMVGWRKRVVLAPQFHENHVLTNTFAYNLLMGGDWPATLQEMKEAEQVCLELGLGPLIKRMPAGLMQIVGQAGWRLSHGEKSRLYIARALLQQPDLVILDESFAALDPPSLHRALQCVLKRAKTLLVIAHP